MANYSMHDQPEDNLELPLGPALEALLFAASGPVSASQLAEALKKSVREVEEGLRVLSDFYRQGRGLRLQWHGDQIQLTTAPEFGTLVEEFLGLEATSHLTRASLEALAIIAYRQPITRPGIDAIRGVNSDGVLKSLLNKGLIHEIGRAEGPGRPILYATTTDFLQYFGLGSISELPSFELASEESDQDSKLLKD